MLNEIKEGTLLWEATVQRKNASIIKDYMDWLSVNHSLSFQNYDELWEWSVSELEAFWLSIWEYFAVSHSQGPEKILTTDQMPEAKWFSGAKLNYTEQVFKHLLDKKVQPLDVAIVGQSEIRPLTEITWQQLYDDVGALRNGLQALGVEKGDRVVAYMPNIPEAIIGFLACASLGATWSSCSPDFGSQTVIDRFKQIEPKVLIAIDGYRYGGKDYERINSVREIQKAIPSIENVIILPYLNSGATTYSLENYHVWKEFLQKQHIKPLTYEQVEFDHPLWILYSSGTTGVPKAIVQGQGNIILEHLKTHALQLDLQKNDRLFWFTTTGWMMWNFLVSTLLRGISIATFDGNPTYPSCRTLWEFVEQSEATVFGTSPTFLQATKAEGIVPKDKYKLNNVTGISATGAPLTTDLFAWVYDEVKKDIWLSSTSGGTDVCSGFVMGSPLHPVRAGEIQTRALGAKVEAYNENGESVIDEVGELVLTAPMPSMPICFWNDENNERYLDSYFTDYEGVWTHGDWIKINSNGSCQIYGRSDSTINRGGIRMGTSEIYRVIEQMEEIADSLIVDLSTINTTGYMPLFIVLADGAELTDELKQKIKVNLRENCSPRHIPNDVFVIKEVPRTLNGKKLEVPIKKILLGMPIEKAANPGAMENPETLDFFVEFAKGLDIAIK